MKGSYCDKCGRFDKLKNLEDSAQQILEDFLRGQKASTGEGIVELRVKGECSYYWRGYLCGLIKDRNLNIRVVPVFEGEEYDIENYCNKIIGEGL